MKTPTRNKNLKANPLNRFALHRHKQSSTAATSLVIRCFRAFGTGLLLIPIFGVTASVASPPSDWRSLLRALVIPSDPFAPVAFDFAHGNGIFVGVGGSHVATSTDGLDWSPVYPDASAYFTSAAFGDGIFVAGWGGGINTSVDGVNWDLHSGLGNGIELVRLRFLNGLFVAVAREYFSDFTTAGVLFTSTDGRKWTRRLRLLPSEEVSDVDLRGIAHGNGRFLIVGAETRDSSWAGFSYSSSDGIEWVRGDSNLPLLDPIDIAFGQAGFVLLDANRLLTSADGATWQVRHELDETWFWNGMASSGTRIVCLAEQDTGDGGDRQEVVLSSHDGISWPQSHLPVEAHSPVLARSLFSDGTGFFAIGARSALSSPDGIAWTEHFKAPSFDLGSGGLSDVVYGDHGFVAVGDEGAIITSPEGTFWEKPSSGTSQNLYDVIYGDGRYVAAGDGGTLLHSIDGQTWIPTDLGGVTLSLGPLATGSGGFVLLAYRSNGFFWTSEDGVSWRLRFSEVLGGFSWFNSLAVGNGRFVAAGSHGLVTSEDGIVWQQVLLPEPYSLEGIGSLVFDGSRFLGTSGFNGLVTSSDGISWTTLNGTRHYAIGYGDGNLVAVRFATRSFWGNDVGLIESSPSGSNWTTVAPFRLTSSALYLKFAYGAGRFVGVGSDFDGTARLLISGVKPPRLNLSNENGKLVLRINGATGSSWNLEHSSTLTEWVPLQAVTLGAEPLEIEVTPTAARQFFWRLAAPDE